MAAIWFPGPHAPLNVWMKSKAAQTTGCRFGFWWTGPNNVRRDKAKSLKTLCFRALFHAKGTGIRELFVRSNGNKAVVGRSVAVFPGEIPTTFSGFCIRFRKTDSSVLLPFLLRALKTDSIRKKMYGRGANIQNLNQQTLASLYIPIPPLDKQEEYISFVQQLDKSKYVARKVTCLLHCVL